MVLALERIAARNSRRSKWVVPTELVRKPKPAAL
jgi:hypothetical protein